MRKTYLSTDITVRIKEGSSWPAVLGRCCTIDQTGCEWLLSSSQWLSTGCEISAATTSALFPLSAWRHLQPKSRPPLRKEQKKNTPTREKVLATSQSLADKTRQIKTTVGAGVLSLLLHLFFIILLLLLVGAKVESTKFTLRRWLTEVYACFNASCSCAKHGIYVLALFFLKNAHRLETLSMDFTDGFPDWTTDVGNKRSSNLDLFHLNGG